MFKKSTFSNHLLSPLFSEKKSTGNELKVTGRIKKTKQEKDKKKKCLREHAQNDKNKL